MIAEIHKHQLTVYFISGQAADATLFENITLPSHFTIKHVHWIEPLKKESFTDYVKRLAHQINTNEDFALIGVSLGGMVAIELNKILQPKLTIIISSIATKYERPPLFKFANSLKLQKVVPGRFYKWYNPLINWLFGVETKREKELLHYYMKNTTINYMQWATTEVLSWKNEERPTKLVHIQGTSDKIFPSQFTHANIKIKKGTHLMVHNRAEEISRILAEKLEAIT